MVTVKTRWFNCQLFFNQCTWHLCWFEDQETKRQDDAQKATDAAKAKKDHDDNRLLTNLEYPDGSLAYFIPEDNKNEEYRGLQSQGEILVTAIESKIEQMETLRTKTSLNRHQLESLQQMCRTQKVLQKD